jgi:hypothetical protein
MCIKYTYCKSCGIKIGQAAKNKRLETSLYCNTCRYSFDEVSLPSDVLTSVDCSLAVGGCSLSIMDNTILGGDKIGGLDGYSILFVR